MDIEELWDTRFINLLAELYVQDSSHEQEVGKHIQNLRARIMGNSRGYNSNESYGMTNDDFGHASEEPLPYIPPTDQTEDGYVGLDPPMM